MKQQGGSSRRGQVAVVVAFPASLVAVDAVAQDNPKFEIVPQLRHSGLISSVAFSADGQRLLSGSLDNTLKLWDAATGRLIRTFPGHSSQVFSVAFSPAGTQAISGGNDTTVKLWDVASGRLIRTFEEHSNWDRSVAFSSDGAGVLSGSDDKTVKLWDAATGRVVRTFKEHVNSVTSVAFSRDGARVLSGSDDKTVKLCARRGIGQDAVKVRHPLAVRWSRPSTAAAIQVVTGFVQVTFKLN